MKGYPRSLMARSSLGYGASGDFIERRTGEANENLCACVRRTVVDASVRDLRATRRRLDCLGAARAEVPRAWHQASQIPAMEVLPLLPLPLFLPSILPFLVPSRGCHLSRKGPFWFVLRARLSMVHEAKIVTSSM